MCTGCTRGLTARPQLPGVQTPAALSALGAKPSGRQNRTIIICISYSIRRNPIGGGHFSISQRWRLGLSVTQPLGESLVVRDSNPLQTAASAHLGSYTF